MKVSGGNQHEAVDFPMDSSFRLEGSIVQKSQLHLPFMHVGGDY